MSSAYWQSEAEKAYQNREWDVAYQRHYLLDPHKDVFSLISQLRDLIGHEKAYRLDVHTCSTFSRDFFGYK